MKENKSARFFCETCDTEVSGESTICPKCGRFFSSVRCPACGFTGEHFIFKQGCPKCGYALNGASQIPKKDSKKKTRKKRKKIEHPYMNGSVKAKTDDALPSWIYAICLVLLLVILKIAFDFLR